MSRMSLLFCVVLATTLAGCDKTETNTTSQEPAAIKKDPALRHVVLFKYKDTSSQKDIDTVVKAFTELPSQIEEIEAFEWGTNNSPEGLNKEFTHSFLVSFTSIKDRDTYLTHPKHIAFTAILKPHLDDVLVVDYWAKN